MQKQTFFIFSCLILLLLAACQERENSTPVAESDSSSVGETAVINPTEVPATEEPTAVPTIAPTATPIPQPTLPPAYEPRFVAADCAFTLPDDYAVACGYLEVPENRATFAENGRLVRLHVARFASERSDPLSAVVYLEGGPGGNALQTLPFIFADNFAPLLADHELIIFDQRGTGYSEPRLDCPALNDLTLDTLDEDLTVSEQQTMLSEAIANCRNALLAEEIDLAAYNSAANAADVDDLRQALGYETWDLYGISYGTRLAQTVSRDFPHGVRSVVLDSTYPPSVNLATDTVANVDRAFDTFFAGCAADSDCNSNFPDLETRFFALVAALDEAPITVPVFHAFTGKQYEALVDGESLLGVLFQSLYATEIIPQLPQLLADVENGRFTSLSTLLSNFLISQEFFSVGTNLSVQCHEEIGFSTASEAETAVSAFPQLAPLFAASFTSGSFAFDICEQWGAGQAAAVENEPIQNNLPTLILAGEYDPITPPAWGQLAQTTLEQATFLEFPGVGHGASTAGDCPQGIMLAFLADPTTPPDTSCVAAMAGPEFVLPTTGETAVTLVPFRSEETFIMEGMAPEGWEEVGPATFLRGQNALDQTVLLHIAAPAAPGVSADFFLNLLQGQLGIDELGDPVGSYESEGRTYALYESEVQGFALDLGVAETDAGVYLVMLLSEPTERDGLKTAVFEPAMAALEIGD